MSTDTGHHDEHAAHHDHDDHAPAGAMTDHAAMEHTPTPDPHAHHAPPADHREVQFAVLLLLGGDQITDRLLCCLCFAVIANIGQFDLAKP